MVPRSLLPCPLQPRRVTPAPHPAPPAVTRAHRPSPPAVTPAHHPVPPVVTPARHPIPPAVTSAHHPAPPRRDIPAHHPAPPRALGGCSVPWGAVRLLLVAPGLQFGENLSPNGLNTPTWAPGSPHPSSGGSGLEWGLLQPREAALLAQIPPQECRKIHTSTFSAAFAGLCGVPAHTRICAGGAAARGKRERTSKAEPGDMDPLSLGKPESWSSLGWVRRAGK